MHKTISEIQFNIQVYAASWHAMCKASAAIAEGLAKLAAEGAGIGGSGIGGSGIGGSGSGSGEGSSNFGGDKKGSWSLNDVVSDTEDEDGQRKWKSGVYRRWWIARVLRRTDIRGGFCLPVG